MVAMRSRWGVGLAAAVVSVCLGSDRAEARVEAGLLTCEVSGGFALIISSPRDLHCVFHKSNGQNEAYAGRLDQFGLDFGVTSGGVIAWTVLANSTALPPGVLAGTYGGVEAGGSVGLGGEGRILVGGSNRTISLQPLSVEGDIGLNFAVGFASMDLRPLFRAPARPLQAPAPAVGHSYNAIPHPHQTPHYGCGSYTHLQRGQTLYWLAHACGVTVEALLDANPQIANVRDISAGALVNLPNHVGHHASSPCGDRAIMQEGESLDQMAWRCGVTLHALLAANPTVRDLSMVRSGLVMTIPDRAATPSGPPVRAAMNETHLDNLATDTVPARRASASASRPTGSVYGQEQTCVAELSDTLQVEAGQVQVTGRDVASNGDALIYVDANGTRAVCEVDSALNVVGMKRLASVAAAAPEQAPARPGNTTQITNNACLAAVRSQANTRDVQVLRNEFSEANTLVMVRVGPRQAPWRCLVSNDGVVAEAYFAGDDSAGVLSEPSSGASYYQDVAARTNQACLTAVGNQANNQDVRVLSNEYSEANTLVMVGVGPQRAPWRCLVSNDGAVAEVQFQGDEGRL